MGNPAERCFYSAQNDGHIGEELFENLRVDDGWVFRTHVVAPIGTIGIFGTQTAVGGVFVHHGVHTARGYAEEQAWAPQLLKVAIITMPVWLWYNGHTKSCRLE